MPILRVGVDLIEVARVQDAIDTFGERFYQRCFTESELAYCRGRAELCAARFAAKEASAKMLGTGIGDLRWKDIEVVREASGRPVLRLHGSAYLLACELGLTTWEVSLTHSQGNAMAFVVATSF
ncbi:MAG TPA: holo-ACP synthase [Aggregatilineales bacterium]|nr:holo-ACP synthase [Aggregatilineales bacterium]